MTAHSWLHHYIPKVFGGIAFLVNPLFVYLIFSGRSAKLGNYRYLLLYFATFNVTYSAFDILVPLKIHIYRYCFAIFISGGMFVEYSAAHFNILIVRCSLISTVYAILICHFLYRYLVIRRSRLTGINFPSYMMTTFSFCMAFFVFWFKVCQRTGYLTEEKHKYLFEEFQKKFDIDPSELNILVALLANGSRESVISSWTGILLLSSLSVFSVAIYILLGFLIMSKLNIISVEMSEKTTKLQRDLLKALIVQTAIPTCFSVTPCLLAWFAPAFQMDLGSGVNELIVIALAVFPFFDPLAIIMCLPVLRHRVFCDESAAKKQQSKVYNIRVRQRGC